MSDDLRADGVARASVVARGTETAYLRHGDGPVVVVLGGCRVIIPLDHPAPDATDPSFGEWLAGFLEGLGATGTTVVAPAGLAGVVGTFTTGHPEMVERVIVSS